MQNRQAGVLQATRESEALGRRVDGLDAENLRLRNIVAALQARIEQVENNQEDIDDVKTLLAWMKNEKAKLKSFFEEARTMSHNLTGAVKKRTQEGEKELDVLGHVLHSKYEDLEAGVKKSFLAATEQGKENWKACNKGLDKKFAAVRAAFSGVVARVEALEMSLPTSALVCIAVCFSLVSYCLVFYCLVFSCLLLLLICF